MLLLHLSDIHFRYPDCEDPENDPEQAYRTVLVRDVRDRVRGLGPVRAILVTGDIAFQAKAEEFRAAKAWLDELSEVSGCPLERVFVVPGNHDVDRSVICSALAVQNAQRAIFSAEDNSRERLLRRHLGDNEAAQSLLRPLTEFNNFAAQFSCQVYPPSNICWRQDIPLGGGVLLRITGLNSTLLSGFRAPQHDNDRRGELYLSPLQTVLNPSENVVNLTMCHHPIDWFMDMDGVEDALNNRAAIQLFGHKHRIRLTETGNYIRFSAGAVNPDRGEGGWEPGYNLIDLNVEGSASGRRLCVRAHVLRWQSSPDRFVPKEFHGGERTFVHHIAIPAHSEVALGGGEVEEVASDPEGQERLLEVEVEMSSQGARNLVSRFWDLKSSERLEIAEKLGLIEASDMNLPEPQRYGKALLRAGQRGLVERLGQEIEEMEKRNEF